MNQEFIDPREDLEGFLAAYNAMPGEKGKFSFRKARAHFHTINHHKWLVMCGCFRLGMYKQGLLHDLSKYNPVEFMAGCRYYQGFKSPNNVEREQEGYSRAWLHHKGRNKHHFEYWTDYDPVTRVMSPVKVPIKYVKEMFCDRVAASKIYMKEKYNDGSALAYFMKGKKSRMIHPETSALLERLLVMLKNKGERRTFAYIRKLRDY